VSRRPPRRGAPHDPGDAGDDDATAGRTVSPGHPGDDAAETGRAGRTAHTGRRGDGRRPGATSTPAASEHPSPSPLRLPSSGLAHEILAAVDRQSPAGSPARPETASLETPPPALGPTRIYSFADSLERGHAAAAAPAVPPERPESWVTFELAGELYALPVARIQEIQRARGITRVPHAPPPVRGIANLRGKVLVVVDLRLRLGLPPAVADERSRILVVSSRQRSLGLLVDAAHQVLGLLPSRIEPPPADLMDERSAYLAGVVQLDDSLVIALDIDQLLLVPDEAATPSLTEAGGPP
jgi:purine-binding chemotaxis protein CheW